MRTSRPRTWPRSLTRCASATAASGKVLSTGSQCDHVLGTPGEFHETGQDAVAVDAIRREIGNGAPPVEAMLRVLDSDLQYTTDQLAADTPGATLVIQRFGELVDSVPILRNYHRGMMDRLVDAAADSLGGAADDPETQIAATSLVGLFRIQLCAIRQLADGTLPPQTVQERVRSEVRRAATVVEHGLRTG
jgi:hypothetical protein